MSLLCFRMRAEGWKQCPGGQQDGPAPLPFPSPALKGKGQPKALTFGKDQIISEMQILVGIFFPPRHRLDIRLLGTGGKGASWVYSPVLGLHRASPLLEREHLDAQPVKNCERAVISPVFTPCECQQLELSEKFCWGGFQ